MLTAFVAQARVEGGMHFYSDVAAGAVVGALAGLLVPRAYRRDDVAVVPMAGGDTNGVAVTVRF